jgi:hypothetical protein
MMDHGRLKGTEILYSSILHAQSRQTHEGVNNFSEEVMY